MPNATVEDAQMAFQRIFEARLDYSILGAAPYEQMSLQVSVWVNGLPLQVLSQEGWLPLELTEDLMSW